jgi:adenine-specific DNA-methyltransferase
MHGEQMQLTDQEKKEIKELLDAGKPLPDKYRFMLFREPHEAELFWPGKTREVTNVVLPFQSIEQIDEPRAETAATGADLFTLDHQASSVHAPSNGPWRTPLCRPGKAATL